MKKIPKLFLTLFGFIILNLYFNLIPTLLPQNDILRFFHLLLFFPLAYILARKLTNEGMALYGVVFYKGWLRNLLLGFFIGFSFWAVLFSLYFQLGKYEFIGFGPLLNAAANFLVILVGFGLGSLINDMIIRGYIINQLKGKIPLSVIFTISLIIYTFDDIWNAGFSVQNTIFSFALGLSLTYSFIKANSIWLNTGIHFGLNVLYGLFFGVSQQIGGGIFLFKENSTSSNLTIWLSTFLSLMILFTVFLLNRYIVVYKAGARERLDETAAIAK
jgi:membrane protease YdiL (CAAX protease family)